MVNFLFLVDTSYVMNQKVPEYGLTLLELCKTAIHRSVNNRRKSIPKPTSSDNNNNNNNNGDDGNNDNDNNNNNGSKFSNKYLLVTHSSKLSIQSGWENTTEQFLKSIESLKANDKPNFGKSLTVSFRLLQSNPNQILSYGQGWKSWQNEMNVIIILTYCIDTTDINISNHNNNNNNNNNNRNEILNLSKRNIAGDELESDWIQWNTRIFVGNISVLGTLITEKNNDIRNALNDLCINTSPSDHRNIVENNELFSLSQMERWITTIMRENSRDGLMIEIWDATQIKQDNNNKNEDKKDNDDNDKNKMIKFNEGNCFREFIIPSHCSNKWPIPESYSPKEKAQERSKSKSSHQNIDSSKHDLPSRKCRPQIVIMRQKQNAPCLPHQSWNVPYEQYEITSPRLKDFLLSLPQNITYYTHTKDSAGTKFGYAKPWGALKGDQKRKKAFLYVFVYDFPFVWNQISVFLQAQKRNFHNFGHEEWKKAVGAYLNFIPQYYVPSVQELLMQTTKGIHLPQIPSYTLDPSIVSYLNIIQKKWKQQQPQQPQQPQQQIDINNDNDDSDDNHTDIDSDDDDKNDEFNVNNFPFEDENNYDDDDDDENNNVLLNVIYKNKNKDSDNNDFNCNKLLELPFITNQRKRNWSKTVKTRKTNYHNNSNDIYKQRRKRRKLFHAKMEIVGKSENNDNDDNKNIDKNEINDKNKWKMQLQDFELISSNDDNIDDMMNNLRLSIFGGNKIKIRDNDSFDILNIKKLEISAQSKLLSEYSSQNEENENNELVMNDQENKLKVFDNSFVRNRVSVYGHNHPYSWKNRYRLIFDQQVRDRAHHEKHSTMGNYTMFADKLRLFKKDELRSPFQNEYTNSSLSLSFVFLQEKINKNNNIEQKQENNKNNNIQRSFLQTEYKLKSNNLLPIKQVLSFKKQISQSIWTKNEISTTFYDENQEKHKYDISNQEYKHSLLKSPDWLSCQVLHNLKPTNLGGNPFKKRRKKSPFPTITKPKNITKAINNRKNEIVDAHFKKQQEQQSNFEQAMSSSPLLASLMGGDDDNNNNNNNNNKNDDNKRNNDKEENDDDDDDDDTNKQSEKREFQVPPPPPPKKSENNKNINKPTAISSPSTIIKSPKIDAPRRKEEVKRAIERAKTQQANKKRQSQILPMKRRANNNTNVMNSNSISNSPKFSSASIKTQQTKPIQQIPSSLNLKTSTIKEPPTKRQKLNTGSAINGVQSNKPSPKPAIKPTTKPAIKPIVKVSPKPINKNKTLKPSKQQILREEKRNNNHNNHNNHNHNNNNNNSSMVNHHNHNNDNNHNNNNNNRIVLLNGNGHHHHNHNNHNNHNNHDNHHYNNFDRMNISDQIDNVMKFTRKFSEMVRGQTRFDDKWFSKQINVLNGLPRETKVKFCQMMVQEARNYNRYKLSNNIKQLITTL